MSLNRLAYYSQKVRFVKIETIIARPMARLP
jgi:hypothetical protein